MPLVTTSIYHHDGPRRPADLIWATAVRLRTVSEQLTGSAPRSSPSRPLGDPGRVQGPGPVPRLKAERTWYTPRVKPLAQEPSAWLATAELIGVVCWLRPTELIGVVRWLRPAELIGIVRWLRPTELISVACWLRPAELIGIVCWLRTAEPVADFRSARAVRTCHLDLHHRYLRQP